MSYVERLQQLETEEDTVISEIRERIHVKELERETAMLEVYRFQNIVVRKTQQVDQLKEAEEEARRIYRIRIAALHEEEKRDQRNQRRAGDVGLEVAIVNDEDRVVRRILQSEENPKLYLLTHLMF
jgi:hypothetical protein